MIKLFERKRDIKRENTNELLVTTLKAELYDKNQEIKELKQRLKREKQIINKIKQLPTSTKKELGIL